jgi:D-alanyl-D-alanine carboxypeptidase
VIRDGKPVWSGASGSLRPRGSERVGEDTPFITASTAKTVTAAMVLKLFDEGRLKLGQPVSRYLPSLPGRGEVWVSDLLRHTSGLPDYLYSPRVDWLLTNRPRHPWTRAEVLRTVRWLDFDPGARFEYSNTNYVALGGIIEKAGEGSVQSEFERLIGDPLDLEVSTWKYGSLPAAEMARPAIRTWAGNREVWSGNFVPTDFWGEVWTDGGLATTSGELGRIANAMIAGDLLEPGTRRLMLRIGKGRSGLCVYEENFDGKRWFGHDGLYEGFTSQHWTNPRSGVTIAVMSNLESGADVSFITWRRLARAWDNLAKTGNGA